ncbi:MAG: carbon-nitrogen hydrolase family protein, partial [Thermoleophilaceae bacterium]
MGDERFSIIERSYSDDEKGLSVGIANIHASVPDVQANKDTIVEVARIFAERGVNYAIFPEFCLSGYFWEDAERCREYMDSAVTDEHLGWIKSELEPLLGADGLEGIVLNNLRHAPGGGYFNSSFVVDGAGNYLADESTYDKVFLPGIERDHTTSGRDDRLVLETRHGNLGFTSCYDYLFSALVREYAM